MDIPLTSIAAAVNPIIIYDNKDSLFDILTALGTLLAVITAVILAVWGESIKNYFIKPVLKISMKAGAPDSHKIFMSQGDSSGFYSYYFRLNIENVGKSPAIDTEVRLLSLYKKQKNGRYTLDTQFLPLNLVWSHSMGKLITSPKIQPYIAKHCDLMHTITYRDELCLMFDTDITPNQVDFERYPTIIEQGEYKLNYVVVSNNVKPIFKTALINFTGKWLEDEKEMLTKGIIVKI